MCVFDIIMEFPLHNAMCVFNIIMEFPLYLYEMILKNINIKWGGYPWQVYR